MIGQLSGEIQLDIGWLQQSNTFLSDIICFPTFFEYLYKKIPKFPNQNYSICLGFI